MTKKGKEIVTESIPQLIRHNPKSIELVCMHEAGHVYELIFNNILPEFVEMYNDDEPSGKVRADKTVGKIRKDVAVAGLSVEICLFRENRLIDDSTGLLVSERDFTQEALAQNASTDKVTFFGEDRIKPNGCWTKEDDQLFLEKANSLKIDMDFVEDLATELLNKKRLNKEEIELIANRHGHFIL